MAPPVKYRCKDCNRILDKKKRHRALSLKNKLLLRPDRDSYDWENDWFCDSCRMKIAPHGRSLKYPHRSTRVSGGNEDMVDNEVEQEPIHSEIEQDSVVQDHVSEITETPNQDILELDSQNCVEMDACQNVCSYAEATYSESLDSMSQGSTWQQETLARPQPKDTIHLSDIMSMPKTQSCCCVCRVSSVDSSSGCRSSIPEQVKESLWIDKRIWVPSNNRSCSQHHNGIRFNDEAVLLIEQQKLRPDAVMTADEVKKLMYSLTAKLQEPRINVESSSFCEADFQILLGVTKASFEDLFLHIKDRLRHSLHRSPRNALAIFLAKLRLGISHRLLAFLFNVTMFKISKIITRVSELLEQYFVPKHLGWRHKSRDDFVMDNDSNFVRELNEVSKENLILILDGTYLYVEKPYNHHAQKSSFSMQKGRNLLKVMIVVSPTGYIVDAAGMYYADGRHNDAQILRHMFDEANGISTLTEAGDVFVLDRGFRDVVPFLADKGIIVKMPSFLNRSVKQFTTAEANESRLVTLVRWVVEAINGRLKNMFRFFDVVIPHQYFAVNCNSKLRRFLRIACAIINKYSPPILKDKSEHQELLERIRREKDLPNLLIDELEEHRSEFIRKKVCWKPCDSTDIENFPRLSLQELEQVCCGKFCIKNAKGYTDEYLRLDEQYIIQAHKSRPNFLRIRLKSKYRGSTSHYLWLEYSNDGPEKIKRYACLCMGGRKSLGVCSHVASVIWYLGYKRHLAPDYRPRSYGEDILEIVSRKVATNGPLGESESEGEGDTE